MQAGVLEVPSPAPDALAHAGPEEREAVPPPAPRPRQRAERQEPAETPSRVEEKADPEPEAMEEVSPQRALQATPLEPAPKAVEEMSEHEVAEAVDQYRKWVHEGQISVSLDFSQISADQLSTILAFYLLRSETVTLAVDPNGQARRMDAIPAGRLIGDVERSHWPSLLTRAATEWLGPMHDTRMANLFFSDRTELEVYRSVARSSPRPGAKVRLRLLPTSDGGITVGLVDPITRVRPSRRGTQPWLHGFSRPSR